jgi:hypothetical protein
MKLDGWIDGLMDEWIGADASVQQLIDPSIQ